MLFVYAPIQMVGSIIRTVFDSQISSLAIAEQGFDLLQIWSSMMVGFKLFRCSSVIQPRTTLLF